MYGGNIIRYEFHNSFALKSAYPPRIGVERRIYPAGVLSWYLGMTRSDPAEGGFRPINLGSAIVDERVRVVRRLNGPNAVIGLPP